MNVELVTVMKAKQRRVVQRRGWSNCGAVLLGLGGLLAAPPEATAARRPGPVPTAQPSFDDALDAYDTTRWVKADRWTNGSPFDNAWRADHVTHSGGRMTVTLDDRAYLGKKYSSGEYRTKGFYGYGCYEARFRAIKAAGVVTSFFTFAGPSDDGGNGRHNEIDVEFLGYDTRRVQFNYWTNDDAYATDNATLVDLPFDASLDAHDYGFRWTSLGVEFYVDGNLYLAASDSKLRPTPKASDSLQKVMMNVWPVDSTAAGWAGTFVYRQPLAANYEWVRYAQGESCQILPR